MISAGHLRKLLLCAVYIAVSASLIRFNKFLMNKDRFPYAMALTSLHMLNSSVLSLIFYWLAPGAFPGMASTKGQRSLVLKWFVPLGLAFAVSLFFSNQAYLYCSVAFLQFMKEANVIITFLLSCLVGLQVINAPRLLLIIMIISGSCVAVTGEMHFILAGFVMQAVSQVAECCRAVMGEMVLGGGGLKLDPLTYTMFVAPTCLVVLLVGTAATWDAHIVPAFLRSWHYILPNTMIAFVLNVLVAAIIKEVSAVGFVMAGLCKDIVLVLASWAIAKEPVTGQQFAGFAISIAGVYLWSYMKIHESSSSSSPSATKTAGPTAGPASRLPIGKQQNCQDQQADETTSLVLGKAA